MEKRNQLFNLYTKAADYIVNNEKNSTAHDLIEEGINALSDTKFTDLYERCVNLINMWGDISLKEMETETYCLIEDISGYLGEYFDD